jgi:hypothetical protein
VGAEQSVFAPFFVLLLAFKEPTNTQRRECDKQKNQDLSGGTFVGVL